jgi:hypothetical protein
MHTANRFVLSCIVFLFLFASCQETQSNCAIENLLLDEKTLPEGTVAERLISPVSEKPDESVARSFYSAPYDIFQMVINWRSDQSARNEYDNYINSAFDSDKYMGPWETPKEMYISTIADNYHIACGNVHSVYQCRFAATYGSYSVFLRADVGSEGITLQKVNEMVQSIDELISQCME